MGSDNRTAWGRWVDAQPRGVLARAQLATELAYSTLHYARTRRVTKEVAELLSAFTGGAVRADDIARPRRLAGSVGRRGAAA